MAEPVDVRLLSSVTCVPMSQNLADRLLGAATAIILLIVLVGAWAAMDGHIILTRPATHDGQGPTFIKLF